MDNFALDISRWVEAEKLDQDKAVRGGALQIFGGIVERTPVLSGALRANWQAELNRPNEATVPFTGAPGAAAATATTKASEIMRGYMPGNVIWFTNNMPYAQKMEEGGSGQAPSGMVDVTLREFDKAIRDSYGTR